MGYLHKSIFFQTPKEMDVASRAQLVILGEARKCDNLAIGGARRLHRIQNIRRPARTADRDQEVPCAPVKFDLLGKHIFITEIIAKTGQGRWIVKRHRAQAPVLRKIYCKMAADAGAAAIAHKHDLVAGIMRRMRRATKPLAAFTESDLALAGVSNLGILEQAGKRIEIAVQPAGEISARLVQHAPALAYFSSPVIALINADFSIERRCPTISTLSAPTTLPIKPT